MNKVELQSATKPLTNLIDHDQRVRDVQSLQNASYWVEYENTLLIPAYPVLLLKGVEKIDLENGTCKLQATFILYVIIEGLQKDYSFIVESLRQRIKFRMNEKPYILSEDDPDIEIKRVEKPCATLVFTYRFETTISFLPNLRSSPFDKIFIPIRIELTSQDFIPPSTALTDIDTERKRIHCRFNFHKHMDQTLKYKDGLMENLIEFNLAYPDMGVAIKKEAKKKTATSSPDIVYAPVVVFTLCFYRLPSSVLINSMGPLLIMMLIPLAIYCQPNDIANKLASLIMLLLAIIAYLPTLRSKLPSMPYLTITDLVAYICIFQVVIGILEAVGLAKFNAVTFSWACLGLLFSLPTVIFSFLGFKLAGYKFKKMKYDKKPIRTNISSAKFDPNEWETLSDLKAIGTSKMIYRHE